MKILKLAFSAKERDDIIARQQAGRDKALRENKFASGGQPFGVWWNNQKKCWEIKEEEYEVLKLAIDLIHKGHSIYYIVDYLNAKGYPTKYKQRLGKMVKWRHGALWGMLMSTDFLYTGVIIQSNGAELDTGIQLFTEEKIQETRNLIKLNRRQGRRDYKTKASPHFLLKRIIKCSCGWFLSSLSMNKGKNRYYRCKRCNYYLNADKVDTKVWTEFVNTYKDKEKLRKAVLGGEYAVGTEEIRSAKEKLSKAETALAEIEKRRRMIFRDLAELRKGVDPGIIKSTMDKLSYEEEKALADKEEAEKQLAKPDIMNEAIETASDALAGQLDTLEKLSHLLEGCEDQEYLPPEVARKLEGLATFHIARRTRKTQIPFEHVAVAVTEQKRTILKKEVAKGNGIVATREGIILSGGIKPKPSSALQALGINSKTSAKKKAQPIRITP
jgi:hypothetical protein